MATTINMINAKSLQLPLGVAMRDSTKAWYWRLWLGTAKNSGQVRIAC